VLRADPPIPGVTLETLRDGTYSLNDLADMHEVLDEEAEYTRRINKKIEAEQEAARRRR